MIGHWGVGNRKNPFPSEDSHYFKEVSLPAMIKRVDTFFEGHDGKLSPCIARPGDDAQARLFNFGTVVGRQFHCQGPAPPLVVESFDGRQAC